MLVPALAAFALVLLGCRSYEPQPLDPDAHAAQWRARSPSSPEVATWAATLSRAFDPADGLALAEAEVVALVFNPLLRQRRIEAGVPLAEAGHAAEWDDPELAGDGEVILADVPDRFILGGLLSLTIPLSGRPGAEKDLLLAQHTALAWSARVAEDEVIALLREAWVAWSWQRERAAQLSSLLENVEAVRRVAQARSDAGEAPHTEVRAFELDLLRLRGEFARLQRDDEQAVLRLRQLLGLTPDAPLTLQPQLDLPLETTPDERRDRVRQTAALRQLHAAHEAAEAAVRLEVRKQYPDLTLGVGFASDQGQSRIPFGFGLPLPSFNRNERGIDRAEGERRVTAAAWAVGVETRLHELAQAEHALLSANAELAFLETELLPLAEQQVADAAAIAALGEFDAALQLDALRQRNEIRLAVLDARRAQSLIRIRLQALAGRVWPEREEATR